MTQASLRLVLQVFLLTTCVIFLVSTLYLQAATKDALRLEYRLEMMRRVGYITAMFDWLPDISFFLDADRERIPALVPFVVSFTDQASSDVRDMTVTSAFPYTAYEYSSTLKTVVGLRESFALEPAFGCDNQVFVVGASFMCLVCSVTALLVKMINLLASSTSAASPSSSGRWRWLSAALACLALLVPVGLSVLAVYAMANVQHRCALRGWADDLSRSAALVGSTYSVLQNVFHSRTPISLLVATLGALNSEFIGGGDYGLYIVNITARTVSPSGLSHAAETLLLDRSTSDGVLAAYQPEIESIIATFEMSEEALLVAGVRSVRGLEPHLSLHMLWMAVALMAVPTICATVAALAAFPFKSLGQISSTEEHLATWAWRTSRHWPLSKLVEAVVLVAFSVFVCSCIDERMATFVLTSSTLAANLLASVKSGLGLVSVGRSLLSNYAMIMAGYDWSSGYLEGVSGVSAAQQLDTDVFYQSLLVTLNGQVYTRASAADMAATRTVSQLPLIMNKDQVSAFLTTHHNAGDTVTYMEAILEAFDFRTLFSILQSNAAALSSGIPAYNNAVLAYGAALDGAEGEQLMSSMIKATLKSAADYAEIATARDKQVKTTTDVVDLFSSPAGREVVTLETLAIDEQRASWPQRLRFDAIYLFVDLWFIAWAIGALVAMGLCIAFDVHYTAWFFGRSHGPSDAVHQKDGDPHTVVPSNDYTAPKSFLTLNYRQLWNCVRGATGLFAAVTAVCVVMLGVCAGVSVDEVSNMVRARAYSQSRAATVLEYVDSAANMHTSTASWMRAYLSRNSTDVVTAAKLTYSWTKVAETTWVDGKPATRDDQHNGQLAAEVSDSGVNEQDLRDNIRLASNLVSAMLEDSSTGNVSSCVYDDFVVLIASFDYNAYIATLAQHASAATTLSFTQALREFAMNLIYMYGSAEVDAIFSSLNGALADCNGCGLSNESLLTHFSRLDKMRRRAAFFPARQTLVTRMQTSADDSTEDTVEVINSTITDETTESYPDLAVAWVPIVLAWICVPLVGFIGWATQRAFVSLYFS